MNKELLDNLHKIHTTKLGELRIKKNLNITKDVIKFCKNIILNKETTIIEKGKNMYCQNKNIILTINKNSFTIITGHIK